MRLTDGRTVIVETSDPIGSPEKPLSAAAMRAKFQDNAANAVRTIPTAEVAAALDMLDGFEVVDDVRALTRMFA
jgi:hypothetical protein